MKQFFVPKIKTMGGLLLLIYIIMAFVLACLTYADETVAGSWKGPLPMGEHFTVVIEFAGDLNSGRVKMFANSNSIQDDELSDIRIFKNKISFFIPAKQTAFTGTINNNTLTGKFVFPGQSEHIVVLQRDSPETAKTIPQSTQEWKGLAHIYNKKELTEDIDVLLSSLFNTHPNPYLFEKKAWFDSTVQHLIKTLAPCDEITLFKNLAPIVARIGCAHTGIRLSPESENALKAQSCFLPLQLYFEKNRAFVVESFNNNVSPGAQLLSINGMTMSDILLTMQRYIPADGYNSSAIDWHIAHNFNWLYALYFEMPDHFVVELVNPQGTIVSEDISGIAFSHIEQFSSFAEHKTASELPKFSITKSHALFTLSQFSYPDFNRYHLYLKKQFQSLKEKSVDALIIDLRGNQGGHPLFAAELLSYLVDDNFVYFKNTDISEFELLTTPLPPKKENFTGQVLILVDGGCLSTTGHFLSLVKHLEIGRLVGETPGSTFYCHDNSTQISLPHTGIRANIPQSIFTTAVDGFEIGEPINIDSFIEPTIDDILNKKDVMLEQAIALIE